MKFTRTLLGKSGRYIFVLGPYFLAFYLLTALINLPERTIVPMLVKVIEDYFSVSVEVGESSISLFPPQVYFYRVNIFYKNKPILLARTISGTAVFSYALKWVGVENIVIEDAIIKGTYEQWMEVLGPIFQPAPPGKKKLRFQIKRIYLKQSKLLFKNALLREVSFLIRLMPFFEVQMYSYGEEKLSLQASRRKRWMVKLKSDSLPLDVFSRASGAVACETYYEGDFKNSHSYRGWIEGEKVAYSVKNNFLKIGGRFEFDNGKISSRNARLDSPWGKGTFDFRYQTRRLQAKFDIGSSKYLSGRIFGAVTYKGNLMASLSDRKKREAFTDSLIAGKEPFTGWIVCRDLTYITKQSSFTALGRIDFGGTSVVSNNLFLQTPWVKGNFSFEYSDRLLAGRFRSLSPAQKIFNGNIDGDFRVKISSSPSAYVKITSGKGSLATLSYLYRFLSVLDVFTYVSLKFSRLHQEGFPIENITGSVSLENGVVSTGDLLMDSGIAKISLEGLIDLRSRKVDMNIFFQALQFIPDLISRVPGLGMLLVGEKKQLLPLIVKVEGDLKNPKVKPLPFDTITKPVFDTMKRVLNLPLKSFKFLFGK